MPYFGGVLDIKRDTKQYKNKVYETGARTFLVTEVYIQISRSCQIFNRRCLVYFTGQRYVARKNTKPAQIPREHSDKDEEESVSTSEAGTNSQQDISDEKSSASFVTVEEKRLASLPKEIWIEKQKNHT